MLDLQEINDVKKRYSNVYLNPLTPLNFLKRSELVFPNRTACVYRGKKYTWKQFAERCYRLGNGLIGLKVKRGDRVAILSRNNNACLESYYGIGLAGAVSVPLNYRLHAKEIVYILNHCESKVLITEHIYAEPLKSFRNEFKTVEAIIEIDSFDKPDGEFLGVPYEKFLEQSSPTPIEVDIPDENDLLSIVYTSGTTGLPKGCMHSHRGAYLNALGEVIEARLTSDSAYLWTLPMFHCEGWCFVWAVTAVGAKHVCLDAVRAAEIYEIMKQEKVTHLCGAPTACSMITEYMIANNLKFPHTVRGLIAGAPPSARNFIEGWNIGLDLHQVYGLTEVYGPHTICEWNSDWDNLSDMEKVRLRLRQGVPYVTCTKVRVVDDQMNDVPKDGVTVGEIVMQGNNVMQGYFREEDKTAEAFRGGWFHSGDAAVVHPDGYIQIVDRIKDIVVTGGEKVSSIEVEAVLMQHPAVSDAAVIGKPDEKWGETVKAIVSLKPGAVVTEKEIIDFCRARLAGFKCPRSVEFGNVPRTATGKIQKNILKKRELERTQQTATSAVTR